MWELTVLVVLAVAMLAIAYGASKTVRSNREPPIVPPPSVEHAYVLQRLCSLEFDVEQLQKERKADG